MRSTMRPGLAAALLCLVTPLAPAAATIVTMSMTGAFQAIPRFGFGNNPFTATLTYDLDSLSYENIISPTFSNVHYGSQGPDGPTAGAGTFRLASDYFSFATQHVFVNFTREAACTPFGPTPESCAQFQIRMGKNSDPKQAILTFWTTDLATFSGPYLPAIAPSSSAVTYAEFSVSHPDGNRIAYIGRSVVDPNAPFSQLAFGGTGGVPEPASWALLIAGFGLTGAVLRRRRGLAHVTA